MKPTYLKFDRNLSHCYFLCNLEVLNFMTKNEFMNINLNCDKNTGHNKKKNQYHIF